MLNKLKLPKTPGSQITLVSLVILVIGYIYLMIMKTSLALELLAILMFSFVIGGIGSYIFCSVMNKKWLSWKEFKDY